MKKEKDYLKKFMKWFFINQLLGFLYFLAFITILSNNYIFAICIFVLFGIGVITTWVGLTLNSYRLWRRR